MAVKRVVQDVLDHCPRLQALTPPKTREVVQWCRQRGYTPPDPEPQRRNDEESIEDILTQIDNEPGRFRLCMLAFVYCLARFFMSDRLVLHCSVVQNTSIYSAQCVIFFHQN